MASLDVTRMLSGMPVPEWGLRVVMVVRQRQRGLGRDAGAAQHAKRCGLPMPAAAAARPAGERRQRTGRAALDLARVAGFQPHPGLARPRRRSGFRRAGHADIGHHRVHFAQPAGRFAQRPAGSRRPLPIRARPAPRFPRRAPARVCRPSSGRSRPRRDARAAAPGQPSARLGCPRPARRWRAIRRARRRADAASAAPCPTRALRGRSSRRSLG